jgi:signal transduction histidine kinase
LHLVNDILDFSKLDANESQGQQVPFDLEELAEVVVKAVQASHGGSAK